MKYYIRTANLECSVNQHFIRPILWLKGAKLLYCVKSPIEVFFLYTEVVNVLPSFLTRTSKNGKNVLVSFSIVNLMLGCLELSI